MADSPKLYLARFRCLHFPGYFNLSRYTPLKVPYRTVMLPPLGVPSMEPYCETK